MIKNETCSIFINTFCCRKMWESLDLRWNLWQFTANNVSEEVKPHMNDFLDTSWFFMDIIQVTQHGLKQENFPMDLFLSQSSSALGKITTLQKLCPLIDPQRDSLWCLVTRNKPGLTFYRSCHEFYWNWCSAWKVFQSQHTAYVAHITWD